MRLIITTLLMVVFLGCHPRKDISTDPEVFHSEEDPFSGHFFNSSKDHLIKSIEIIYDTSKYRVTFRYAEGAKIFSGLLLDNEIVVEEDDNYTFHLYLNVEELRVYKVVKDGYQPEDIELTFYKMK